MSNELQSLVQQASQSGRFKDASINGDTVRCRAKDASAEAWYVIDKADGHWSIALETADRWLSESIEGDMLEGRDTAEELVDDELVNLDFPNRCPQVKHYRNDDKVYVFRSRVPLEGIADETTGIATYLLAFEAAFSQLGDMQENAGA
jgi:hypothetical protein